MTNVLLAAAKMAYPHIKWYLNEVGIPCGIAGPEEFDINNPADAFALWKALAKNHIIIYADSDERWVAEHACAEPYNITANAETPEEAMVEAVEEIHASISYE